jgi:hypothetical protein
MTPHQLTVLNSLVTYAMENMPGNTSEEEREVAKIVGQWALQGFKDRRVRKAVMTTYVFWGKSGNWSPHGTVDGNLELAIEKYEKILAEQITPVLSDSHVPDGMLFVSIGETGYFRAIETTVNFQIELVNKSALENTNPTKYEQDNTP